VLDISGNGLTPEEALAISDMMKILEELNLSLKMMEQQFYQKE